MYIKQDMDFNDLMNNCWSGAIDTLKTIEENDKENELMTHLEEIFETIFDNVPTMTEVNDYLRFKWETIFECLGISETEDEEEEEEEIDYEEGETEKQCVTFDSFCSKYECEKCPYDEYCKTMDDCRQRYLDLKWPDDEDDEKDENGGYIVPLF